MDERKKLTEAGFEYWMARDIMLLLAYTEWRNFRLVIEKAKVACCSAKSLVNNHFVATTEMVPIGSGAYRSREDCFLSRYACDLIAMNADPTKQEVAFAMAYFAVQTRRQELSDEQKRLDLRLRIIQHNRVLAGVAKEAGVKRYAIFQDAGYRGLYGMGLSRIKSRKGLTENEDLLDRAGRLELAANDFRITLAENRLRKDAVRGEGLACRVHETVGQNVREVMVRDHGQRPEDLPVEPSIKKLVDKQRRQNCESSKGILSRGLVIKPSTFFGCFSMSRLPSAAIQHFKLNKHNLNSDKLHSLRNEVF